MILVLVIHQTQHYQVLVSILVKYSDCLKLDLLLSFENFELVVDYENQDRLNQGLINLALQVY